ncbi:MAG: Gfo/Idh/MocA family oxidoreductase [Clostridia bacterium]|nr:Gfo/Idh/MocA family oxidoreductase [Clostridia bacterium]
MVRVGIIGVGGISRKHIYELLEIKECKITAICDIDPAALKNTAERLGIDEAHCFADYRELVDCSEVDAVEICTPNYLHVQMAEYAVMQGKPVNVEKPLALKTEDTGNLDKMIRERNHPNMMCFSYRFMPGVRYAKHILDRGLIGKMISINVEYLKSTGLQEGRRLEWRFIKEYAGTGVLGDLGVHLIDMMRLLVGDVKSVSAMAGIVVKKRLKLDSDELGDVETDDYCNFIAEVEDRTCGECIPASFAITRCAVGHANTIKFDIFGTDGTISFDLNNPSILKVCIGEVDKNGNGLHTVTVPDKFKIKQEQMFIDMVNGKNCEFLPTIEDGIECQKILDAILESSETGRRITLK